MFLKVENEERKERIISLVGQSLVLVLVFRFFYQGGAVDNLRRQGLWIFFSRFEVQQVVIVVTVKFIEERDLGYVYHELVLEFFYVRSKGFMIYIYIVFIIVFRENFICIQLNGEEYSCLDVLVVKIQMFLVFFFRGKKIL